MTIRVVRTSNRVQVKVVLACSSAAGGAQARYRAYSSSLRARLLIAQRRLVLKLKEELLR
jgi:hypothetical protein